MIYAFHADDTLKGFQLSLPRSSTVLISCPECFCWLLAIDKTPAVARLVCNAHSTVGKKSGIMPLPQQRKAHSLQNQFWVMIRSNCKQSSLQWLEEEKSVFSLLQNQHHTAHCACMILQSR